MSILIHNCTAVLMDEAGTVLPNAYVVVEGTKIRSVSTQRPWGSFEEQIDGLGNVLMPGFVNAHSHVPMTAMRGYGDGNNLQDWLHNYIFPVEARWDDRAIRACTDLGLAEMIASLSKPTVSLVIGDSHSIGVPLAVASDYSFIVPTGTMLVHPVRMSGMVIGTAQTYEYFEMIEDRIISFVSEHSRIDREKLKKLMHNTKMLTKDLGTVLVGKEAVECGLIDGEGGIRDAIGRLNRMMEENVVSHR